MEGDERTKGLFVWRPKNWRNHGWDIMESNSVGFSWENPSITTPWYFATVAMFGFHADYFYSFKYHTQTLFGRLF